MTILKKYARLALTLAGAFTLTLLIVNSELKAQNNTDLQQAESVAAEEKPEQPTDPPAKEKQPKEKAEDENKGLEALNQATEIKMTAEVLRDLNSVIRLCEKAKEDGLSKDNLDFCNQLLSATQLQRGMMISDLVLEVRPLPPGWKEYRKLAVADFENASKYLPEEPMVYLYISRLNVLPEGDRELSAKYADKTIELSNGNAEIHAQALVVKADLSEDVKKKIELLKEANQILPENLPIFVMLGVVYAANNQQEESLDIFRKALELDSDNVQALEFSAAILVQQEKIDEAIKIYDKLTELQPRSLVPLMQKAEALQLLKKYEDAQKILDSLRSKEPGNPLILLQRSKLFAAQKDYESALRDVDAALRLAGDIADLEAMVVSAKIAILCEQDKFADALTVLNKLPKKKQNDPRYRLMFVQVYTSAKANTKALEILDGMLEEQPDNNNIKRFRGDILLGLGRHKEAIAIYKKLLEDGDDDEGTYNNLAWVLATSPDDSLRDGKVALEYALKSSELTYYKKPHILSTLASAYAEIGDFENAQKWIVKALEVSEATEYDQKEHLEKEKASYQEKKPWREQLNENESDPLAALPQTDADEKESNEKEAGETKSSDSQQEESAFEVI
ncbi:MAG: tetratricopeptide repeat protein [Planctomycetaceae bacterium]|jgi:tetratricopeptide (TPR) repeat protein|nr:tetratricopeptide repeat protein [Planctomycetaceae bacterium]